MSTTDEVHVDFMHVSTYVPVVFQLLRASVFLTLHEALLFPILTTLIFVVLKNGNC